MTENEPESSVEVVAARLAEVTARFGQRLSPEQLEQIKGRIERTLKLSTALRLTPLTNADEPEIVFAPCRGEA